LDIHQIHTGRGNSALAIFPDGTTLLIDAGAIPDRTGLEIGPARPNASRTTAEWIAHYIRQFVPLQPAALDYLLVTHYHDDHMGALPALANLIPIRTLIDRGDDPKPPPYPAVRTYFELRGGFRGQLQTLRVGRDDQIVLRHTPGGNAAFRVRNVAGNGMVWTGKKDSAGSAFPRAWKAMPGSDQLNENAFSLALRIEYGPFSYYTGGDLIGLPLDGAPTWHDLETPVARVLGPVDAAVLNHHGWLDSTNAFFLRTLRPRVVVIPAWHATHPDHSVLRRLRSPAWKDAKPDLFITTLLPATRAIFSYLGTSFQNEEGHILIRVAPGGGEYNVIVMDAAGESPRVKTVHGPYRSRGTR
jgi:hypothetical protein